VIRLIWQEYCNRKIGKAPIAGAFLFYDVQRFLYIASLVWQSDATKMGNFIG
jgi:hypothetical protein